MFEIHFRWDRRRFNRQKWTKTFESILTSEIKEAVRAMLRRLEAEIPVYSGAVKSAFQPLARDLRVVWSIRPNPDARPSGKEPFRSEFGIHSSGASDYRFFVEHGNVGFEFEIHLEHFKNNEWADMRAAGIHLKWPSPWHLQQHMLHMLREYLIINVPEKLPRLRDFLEYGGTITL
jgi:hypothetical protein